MPARQTLYGTFDICFDNNESPVFSDLGYRKVARPVARPGRDRFSWVRRAIDFIDRLDK